jgi:hypothetical protein
MVFDKNKSLLENIQNLEPETPSKPIKKKTGAKPQDKKRLKAFIRKNKKALMMAAEADSVYVKLCRKGQPDKVLKMDMKFQELIKREV